MRYSLLIIYFISINLLGQNYTYVLKKADSLITVTEYAQAETLLNSILNNGTEFQNAATETSLGFLLLNKGRYDLSIEKLQKAQNAFQALNKLNTAEGARCLSVMGLVYGSTGKYKQAEENHLLALQIREQLFGKKSEEVAASYNDLGLIYFETDPDKSLGYFESASDIYKSIHGENHPKIAIASTNIGFAYRKLELFGDAIVNFENAKALWEKIYPAGHPNQALVLSYLGQVYRQMKNTKVAKDYFVMALNLYKKFYGDKHPDIANTYNDLGILDLNEQKYTDAIQNFHKAVVANSPSFENSDVTVNPSIKEYYNGKGLLYSLRYKAQSLEELYYGKTLKLDNLKLALSCLHSCDTLIEDIRHHSVDENDKISLGEIASEVYEDAVRIAYSISEVTIDSKFFKEEAFYFAEKSKSAVLQESIADAQAKSFSGIPNELLEQEKNLKSNITYLSQKLSMMPGTNEEKKIRESLFSSNQEYTAFIMQLERNYPNYYNLKFNQSSPTVSSLQNNLSIEKCIVSYFVATKSKRVYQFIVQKNQFKVVSHNLPDDFDKLVRGFNNSLYYSDFDTYKLTANSLKKILVPKLPGAIKSLIIIPSGRLGTMPFEALPLSLKDVDGFSKTQFLINKYAISYEFSSALMLQKDQKESVTSNSIFLCAPVNFSEDLPELPGSEKEVSTISQLFGSKSKVASRMEANETVIKNSKLSEYSYLHFATHGTVNETSPELSRIFLNSSANEDGSLYSGEIFNLQLNAKLAVLSACQTGLGKLSKGEGVIGLSRALTYAGAKNIIVSFWSVADESTSELMTELYRNILQNNNDFSSALRNSKLKLINDPKFAAPYYWAPFVMIGN